MNKPTLNRAAWIIGIPTLYAVLLRLVFGVRTWQDLFPVMSVTFLLCLPFLTGMLTIYLSDKAKADRLAYRIFVPWIPILLFFLITLALAWEGWACWIMVLPLFLFAASIGGLIGGYLKKREKKNRVYASLLPLLPLLISPLEQQIGAATGTYKAYTFIDIEAPADVIWNHVTRVYTIPQSQDKGWLTRTLGFPRPVRAELNYNGVGAYRKAIFTNGLVFHETVTEYRDQEKMVFSIKAYPHEIPATTLDEHVAIGGQYFDVLTGTYELEQIKPGTYRLHLWSYFKLNTTFNFYARWWAAWIMKDIQHNILQIQKIRSENS